jgi:hypothetical protein
MAFPWRTVVFALALALAGNRAWKFAYAGIKHCLNKSIVLQIESMAEGWLAWADHVVDADLNLLDAFESGIPREAFEDKVVLLKNLSLFILIQFGVVVYGLFAHSIIHKVVWVTGAARGLGKALAIDMCSRGAKVVVSARTEHALQFVREECQGTAMAHSRTD